MKNNIPAEDIEQLKQKIDIVDLIGGYVKLSTSGKSFKGLCPFHSEKDGSFHVYNESKTFSCFGCGKSGDAIHFIQEIENLDFRAAYDFLVEKYGGNKTESKRPKKASLGKKAAAKFVSLPREEALGIFTEEEIIKLGEYVIKKKVIIPENGWYPYYNAENNIDIMVIRFNHDSGKDILTFYYDGKNIKMKNYPVLLYNRHHLAARPDDQVIIHEGEKCCNIGTEKLPEFVHTTWNGGGKKFINIQNIDILAGRKIYLLADDDQKMDKISGELMEHNDQPGQKTMIELKNILEKL